jgi:4-diphosphocytidyl-2-C-methyl-D-erythritol kinase
MLSGALRSFYVKTSVKAYAKLNLFLDILGKRDDGYHEVLTAMCLIDLADDIEITVDEGSGIIGVGSDNTAYRAAELFLGRLGVKKHVGIDITKRIPVMAGLGGSSADAAAVLGALNKLLGKPFSLNELMQLGAEIGSDVPFMLHGGHALCRGRGTEIAEVLPLPDCVFVIVKPEFDCPTKEAYARYSRHAEGVTPYEPGKIYNVFERLHNNPEITRIKQELTDSGASAACMTGSGSAVFGVFADMESAREACSWLNYTGKFIAIPVDKHINL